MGLFLTFSHEVRPGRKFDFSCSPQGANKNAPPNGVCTARQACALGCEGIVSKRPGLAYRSGRADCWLEVKNPKCALGHARGRGGLELLSHGSARSMRPRRLPEPPFRRIASPLMQPSPIGRRVVGASPSGRALGAWRPEPLSRSLVLFITSTSVSAHSGDDP
jgi:hypothetical protein